MFTHTVLARQIGTIVETPLYSTRRYTKWHIKAAAMVNVVDYVMAAECTYNVY